PETPQLRKIEEVTECLKNGGIIAYPTDTVYGFGCDLYNPKAIERIYKLKGTNARKFHLSFICYDLSDLSNYARVSTPIFKIMKRLLPGPYTFILESSSRVPKIFNNKKKQVGIRVPNHNIPRELVLELGNPILTTSIKRPDEDDVLEYFTEAYEVEEAYGDVVDIIIDGGTCGVEPSTVLKAEGDMVEVVREGLGKIDF
ncbi:MAG: L-threonylcarbamoyladenylate synthase, partial [Bacteroidota bacterium]